ELRDMPPSAPPASPIAVDENSPVVEFEHSEVTTASDGAKEDHLPPRSAPRPESARRRRPNGGKRERAEPAVRGRAEVETNIVRTPHYTRLRQAVFTTINVSAALVRSRDHVRTEVESIIADTVLA